MLLSRKLLAFFGFFSALSLLLSAAPEAARAEQYEKDHVRKQALRAVFGPRVTRGLDILPEKHFKGAREYACDLASRVIAKELSVREAREALLLALRQMERGETPEALAQGEPLVIGKMPIGDVVSGKMPLGAGQVAPGVMVAAVAPETFEPSLEESAEETAAEHAPIEQVSSATLEGEKLPSEHISPEEALTADGLAEEPASEQASTDEPLDPLLEAESGDGEVVSAVQKRHISSDE